MILLRNDQLFPPESKDQGLNECVSRILDYKSSVPS